MGVAYPNNFSSFGLEVAYKYNNNCPITFEEYRDRILELYMNVLIVNEEFDPSDREDPVKRLVTDQYGGYFNPEEFNVFNIFVERNTYEIEGGLFNSEKTGKFYTAVKEKNHSTKFYENKIHKLFLTFEVLLDKKITHFRSISYGIVDAIGTLGGAFGIISW